MHINKNVAISENGFLFNASRGDSYLTNSVALLIINLLKENKSLDDIKEYLLVTYEVDESTLEKDLYDFLKMMKQYSLIEE